MYDFFSCALREDKHRQFLHNNDFEARWALRGSPELCEKMTRIFTWEIFLSIFSPWERFRLAFRCQLCYIKDLINSFHVLRDVIKTDKNDKKEIFYDSAAISLAKFCWKSEALNILSETNKKLVIRQEVIFTYKLKIQLKVWQ